MGPGSKNAGGNDSGSKKSSDGTSESSNDRVPIAMKVTSDEVNYLVFRYELNVEI